jgi:uncharacterized protein (TIRG00374 family)
MQRDFRASSDTPISKIVFFVLRLAVGVGVLIWLQKSGAMDFSSFMRLFRNWLLTVAAIVILFVDILLMAVRISALFRVQNLTLARRNALRLTLIGSLFSMLLPGTVGGEVAKFYYASCENHGRRAEIAAALLIDRLVGFLSLILLPLLFAPFFISLVRTVPVIQRILWIDAGLAIALPVGMFAVASSSALSHWVSGLLGKWSTVQKLWDRATQAMLGYGHNPGAILYALFLSLLANGAFIVVTALGLYASNPGSFSVKLFFVAPVGYLVNALPLTPGGLGVGEAAFNAFFKLAGMSGGADALFCVRVWNGIIGLLGLPVYLYGMGRIVKWSEKETLADSGASLLGEPDQEPQFDGGR